MRKFYSTPLCYILTFVCIPSISADAQHYYSFGGSARADHGANAACWFEKEGQKHLVIDASYGFEYFVEQANDDGTHFYRHQSGAMAYSVNAQGGIDLKRGKVPGEVQPAIMGRMDVDRDGIPDLIVQTDLKISWMRCAGNGNYEPARELVQNAPLHPDAYFYPSGVLVFTDYSLKSREIIVVDCRNGAAHISIQRKSFKNDYWHVGMWEENGAWFACLFHDESTLLLAPMKGSQKEREFHFPEKVHEFVLGDFNKDGNLDFGRTDILDVRIFSGDSKGNFTGGGNLLEPMSAEFIEQLMKWERYEHLGYNKEEYQQNCIDWLSDGDLLEVDFNVDGFPDLLYQGEYFVAFMNEAGKGFRRELIGGPYDPDVYKLVDLNKDNQPEIVIDAFSGQYLIQFDGTHFHEMLITPYGYMEGIGSLDMDQDGDLDVLFFDNAEDLLWSENKNGVFSQAIPYELK